MRRDGTTIACGCLGFTEEIGWPTLTTRTWVLHADTLDWGSCGGLNADRPTIGTKPNTPPTADDGRLLMPPMNVIPDDARETARQVPDHLRPFASAAQVRFRVGALGAEIGTWARQVTVRTGRQPLALCILRGGVFFFSDLMLACPVSMEPAFCRCRAYRENQNGIAAESVEIRWDPPDLAGRHILVVDDICDSGRTLAALAQHLAQGGAAEIASVVCVHRLRADSMTTPRWSAFVHDGPEWFAGYGMEDASHHMNLPGLYLVQPAGGSMAGRSVIG